MNKKIIFVILLFIGISFIVYSFASPLTESDDNNLSQNNGGQNENNNSYNDKDDKDKINNSDIIKDLNEDDDENKDEEENDENNSNLGNNIVVTRPPTSTNRPSTGNSGSGSNGNYTVNPPVDVIDPITPINPDPTIPEEPNKPDPTPEGPKTLFASTIELDKDPSIVVPLTVTSDRKDTSSSTNFLTLSGVMQAKNTLVDGITTGYYVTLKLYVPNEFTTKESLKDLTVTTKTKTLTQAEHNLVKEDSNGYYIVWNQAFRTGGSYSITVNWNDETIAIYQITCDIETF